MREMLRSVLGRSLRALSAEDRLAAAWPVAAGHGIAGKSSVVSLDGPVLTVEVADAAWQSQLNSMRGALMHDLMRIARTDLTDILFVVKGRPLKTRVPKRNGGREQR